MAQTTSLVFNGGVIPSPSPAPSGSGKAKLLKIGEITVTEQEAQVTKNVICDPDSVTTVAPFMEVLTSARLAELVQENNILVLDDGTMQYLMSDASIAVEDGTAVCTAVNFLGLSKENRAKVLYPCTRLIDELTLQQVIEVGEPVETDFDLVKAYPEDTEAGTLIDKLEIEDTIDDDPDYQPLLELFPTDGKVAINEDGLHEALNGLGVIIDSIVHTIDELDVDSVPHAYLHSTLNHSAGDSVTTRTEVNVFAQDALEGDCFEFEQTTTIDDTPFGYVWIEPGTYLINASVTLQWVGDPRGTFVAKVGSVMGENFDFSQEQEIKRNTTKVVTIPNRMKLAVNITYDKGTPVMGFWIQSMQVVKLAGGMSQTTVAHNLSLVGTGSVDDPLGIGEHGLGEAFQYAKDAEYFATKQEIAPLATKSALQAETARATQRENEIEALFVLPTQEAVDAWLAAHPEATSTVQDHSLTEQKFTNELALKTIKDYLTPQMFGAKGDGVTDDTQAFRDLFIEAARQAVTGQGTFKGCQKIYVPAGKYIVTGTIVDSSIGIAPCALEVFGAGRENTLIICTAAILLNNYNVFAFSTFHNIGFIGDNSNTFLAMQETSSYGVQRINFISCRFTSWQTIVNAIQSETNMSECSFLACKIHNCGTDESPCVLFIFDNPQLVNWRFIGTDIETFKGVAFDFVRGAAVSISNSSIIPLSSNSVVFNCSHFPSQTSFGPANGPQVTCYSVRFELRDNSTLLYTNGFRRSGFDSGFVFTSVFFACLFNLVGALATNKFIRSVGAFDFYAFGCSGITGFNVSYTSVANAYSNPKIVFNKCIDAIDFDVMKSRSSITLAVGTQNRNAPHIIVDDKYSFIMSSSTKGFVENFVGDRRSVDFFNDSMGSNYILPVGKTVSKYILGFITDLEITIRRSSASPTVSVTVDVQDDTDTVIATDTFSFNSTFYSNTLHINKFCGKVKVSISHNSQSIVYMDVICESEVI